MIIKNNKKRLLGIIVMLAGIVSITSIGYGQMPTALTPTKDTYIRGGSYASTNYDNEAELVVKNTTNANYHRKAELKFDLTDISNVEAATISLYATKGTTILTGVGVYETSNGGSENNATWNNAQPTGDLITITNIEADDTWYEWDVTAYVQENEGQYISFVFEDTSQLRKIIRFSSKEGDNPPQLNITMDSVDNSKDIYLVIGQSNTAGRGEIEAQDETPLANADLFHESEWQPATNPMNAYSTIRKDLSYQKLGYSYTFARAVGDEIGETIGLVVNARGGTNINAWAKGADEGYYQAAVDRVNQALAETPDGVVKGILWHQGESSRYNLQYLTRLEQLISDLRSDFDDDTIPFVAGQLSPERSENDGFNTRLQQLPNLVPYTDYVSSEGLTTTDLTHFDSDSQRVLGERYASKILSMVYGIDFEPKDTVVPSELVIQDFPVTEDAYVRGGVNTDTTYGDDSLVRIKETSTTSINSNTRRGYLEFDLSEFNGGTISSANLIVFGEVQGGTESIDVTLYDVADWNESTLTFSNSPSLSNEITNYTFTGSGSYAIDVTSFIQAYINEPTVSIGLKSNTIGNEQLKLYSRENTVSNAYAYLTIALFDN